MGYSINRTQTSNSLTERYNFTSPDNSSITSLHFHRPYKVNGNFRENFSLSICCTNANQAENLYQSIASYAVSRRDGHILVVGRNAIWQLLDSNKMAETLPEKIIENLKNHTSFANNLDMFLQQPQGLAI